MSGLFGSSPQTPALPPTVKQPAPDDQASLEAKRQAVNQLAGMDGREATDLSGPSGGKSNSSSNGSGSGTFVNDVLGK